MFYIITQKGVMHSQFLVMLCHKWMLENSYHVMELCYRFCWWGPQYCDKAMESEVASTCRLCPFPLRADGICNFCHLEWRHRSWYILFPYLPIYLQHCLYTSWKLNDTVSRITLQVQKRLIWFLHTLPRWCILRWFLLQPLLLCTSVWPKLQHYSNHFGKIKFVVLSKSWWHFP